MGKLPRRVVVVNRNTVWAIMWLVGEYQNVMEVKRWLWWPFSTFIHKRDNAFYVEEL